MIKKFISCFMLASSLLFGSEAVAAISTSPVTPGATEAAQKLYTFLYNNYGKKTISGIMTGDNGSASALADQEDVKTVLSLDGDIYPAIIGFDWLMATGPSQDQSWFLQFTKNEVAMAKELWSKGGIPAFCWHWRDPSHTVEEYSDSIVIKGYFDLQNAFVAGSNSEWDTTSATYKYIITDIDKVSSYMLQLQEKGVAVIWRPLHEAAGQWFWWSKDGPEQYVALYKLLFDRMVNVNGIKNCIWVWNIERNPTYCSQYSDWYGPSGLRGLEWYPGDEYVDVIGVDIYNRNANTSGVNFYNKIAEVMGDKASNKMLTLSETDYIPDITAMQTDNAMWSWWMPWDNSWSKMIEMTSSDVWKSNMSNDNVITLKDMADWGTYIADETPVVTDPCTELQNDLRREAECGDLSGTSIVSANDASGAKAVCVTDNAGYIKLTFNVATAGVYDLMIGGYLTAPSEAGKVAAVEFNGATANVTINASEEYNVGAFKLAAGENIVTIKPGWTWFVIDYARLEADADAVAPITPSSSLVTPNATEAANKLYSFLVENFGKKTISGFMTGDMSTANGKIKEHEDVQAVYTRSGKYPALVGFDFMNATGKSASQSWYKAYTDSSISLAKNLYSLGGIPAFTWHWRDPSKATEGFYANTGSHTEDGTAFVISEAMNADGTWNTTSTNYQNMIADIDVVADYFLDLQDAGVAAIFRPLHEASGAWFWWGKEGAENCVKLYQLIYDEMVNVKGVKNLVWVWNPQLSTDEDWNPGANYYDVISIDIYNSSYDYQSNYVVFNNLKKMSSKSKLIAYSECGPVADVDNCFNDEAVWSWWMNWYQSWSGNFADQTSNDEWKKQMTDERVITLEDMPGWANYTHVQNLVANNNAILVFPTIVKNNIYVVVEGKADVTVSDITGKTVMSSTINGSSIINASSLNKGIYLVKVSTANQDKTFKIIK